MGDQDDSNCTGNGDQLAVPPHLAEGVIQHHVVPDRLRHRRYGDDPVLSADRHSLAGTADHVAGYHQRVADLDRVGNVHSGAPDAAASGV